VTVPLAATLASHRAAGRKLLIAYVMAGSTPQWVPTARALVAAGVDVLEIGLAFSDPMIDGAVIQAAATAAIEGGMTTEAALRELAGAHLGVPLVAMTYCNVVAARGYGASAAALAAAGVAGAIIADLPLEEVENWRAAAAPVGIETVLLAAPATPPERLDAICARAEGFVYAVGRMATTGESATLDPAGLALVDALRARTSLPVCLGIGVTTPAQAAEVCGHADGVIVGSAIVRRMLEGATPEEVGAFASALRAAIDAA